MLLNLMKRFYVSNKLAKPDFTELNINLFRLNFQ